MSTFQDLPDELLLKILSFSETEDLIGCGQISKRIRRISHDGTLWVKANLEKKIVKTELLEMILRKGCRILNLSHSKIIGTLSLNVKSQLTMLYLFGSWSFQEMALLERLLSSCCSLEHLVMEGVWLTTEMVDSICKNGKTLQILNLNDSFLDLTSSYAINYLQEIIKSCQKLKEVNLGHVNVDFGLLKRDLEFLIENIPSNIEKLTLSNSEIKDNNVEVLLRRCNKIKVLSLEATWITDDSLKSIRQHLNLTLEELSLGTNYDRFIHDSSDDSISLTGFLELKYMPRLTILNLFYENGNCEEIQNLKRHLPHLMIKGVIN